MAVAIFSGCFATASLSYCPFVKGSPVMPTLAGLIKTMAEVTLFQHPLRLMPALHEIDGFSLRDEGAGPLHAGLSASCCSSTLTLSAYKPESDNSCEGRGRFLR